MASNSKTLAELLDSGGDVLLNNLDNLGTAATNNTGDFLQVSNNLSDLNNVGTTRTNLGLGTAATNDTGDFLQVSNNFSDINNSDTALTNLGFSAFGKSIIDDADAAAVRTTLGLGEAATADTLGGSQDFTATGTLANGDIVGLRSDGTVEVIADGTQTFTNSAETPVVFESANTVYISATFDSNTNKVVIAYQDSGNFNYGTAIVGTVSGTSITFGSSVVFESADATFISATFDSNTNKVVVAYRDGGNSYLGTAVVGTVSGTSISFGTPVIFNYANSQYISATFDSNTNRVVIAYRDIGNSYRGTAVVGTVSGSSISFGTPVVFESTSTQYTSTTFDSNTNQVVIAYQDEGIGGSGTAVVGTVSGTSISFGTPVVFESANTIYISATFDSNTNKVVIAYSDGGNAYYGTAVVGTVSGTSISFGTPVVFESAGTYFSSATFDSNTNKVVIAYQDDINSNYGTAVVGTVSGTSISFGTPVVFESDYTQWTSAIFDTNTNKVVIAYQDYANSLYGTALVFQAEGTVITTNADSWIGIADGTSGTVTIMGGVAEGLTGLTTGTTYYVNYDGTLTTTENAGPITGTYGKIGKALSSTQLFITEGNA